MGLFSTILDKLGIHKQEAPAATSGSTSGASAVASPKKPADMTFVPAQPAATTAAPAKPAAAVAPAVAPVKSAAPVPVAPAKDEALARTPDVVREAPKPAPVSEVDVVKKLEGLAAAKPMKLNWKTSIADLLYLLDMENSLEARKALATELNCPPELMHDSAKMNTWLHKEVLRQIAQNGGNIPKELLD